MKTIRLSLIALMAFLLAAITPLHGQKLKPDAVPEEVKQTMDFEYSNVKILYWELIDGVYIANFKEDNSPGKCYITKNGQWQKTVYPVPRAELPSAITDYVNQNFANYTIAVSQLQEMPNVRIHYYIEAKPEGVGYEPSILTFNEVGALKERHDPANFDKEAKSVVDPKAAAKPATASASGAAAGKATASNNTGKPAQSSSSAGKPATNTGKPATSSTASNAGKATSTTGKPASSQSTGKPTQSSSSASKPASNTGKPATSSTASNAGKATSTTGKPASSQSASKPSTPATANNSKPKKEKEEKPVYDERGNKAIDANSVPANIKATLSKKVQRPEELHWFKVDTFYVANFIAREQKNEVFIGPSGVWVKTFTVLPEVSVSGNMAKHLQTYYKGYRFKNAIKETRADKKDVVMVEIYEKDNWKQKLVTTFYFDKTGKLLRTVDPDYELGGGQSKEKNEDESLEKYYEKMNMSNKSDDNSNIPKDVLNAFKAKYPHVTGVTWAETSDGSYSASYYGTRGKEICIINSYGTITETMTLGNPDNLLSSISSYIKQNYKNNKIVEYYAVKKIIDKKNFYKVIIADKKTKVEQELWFTTSGKFVE